MNTLKTWALAALTTAAIAVTACGGADTNGNEGAEATDQASTTSTCWSHSPSYAGQTCILKTQCHWITPGNPPQPCTDISNSECVRHCEKECLYPCTLPPPLVPPPPLVH